MSLASLAKSLEKFSVDNSPAILTAVGVAGTITTALLSAKAGVESSNLLRDNDVLRPAEEAFRDYTTKQKIQLTWKVWVLPVGVGTITCTSIIMANRIGTRRAAAMATAYVITEKAFEDYKVKVVEKLGANKEQAVRDEIAQDRVLQSGNSTIVVGSGKVLCYEQFTARYFESSVEAIKSAQNNVNYRILHDGYASQSDFYNEIGLPLTSESEDIGWNSDKMLEIQFSTVMSEDQRPCISIDYGVTPVRDYHKFR